MTNQTSRPATGISALSLIAYDYQLLLKSLPGYLDYVDEVILGLDRKRLTWKGNQFSVPPSFFETLKRLDQDNKIKIIEDDFYCPELNPLEADTRERNILSQHVAANNWILSIDADEYLLDAPAFLLKLAAGKWQESCLLGSWIVVYKELDDCYLVIGKDGKLALELFPLATKQKETFTACRYTEQPRQQTGALALHFSWARNADDIVTKASNWSHSQQINIPKHVQLWQSIDADNYTEQSNLHPLDPALWPGLIKLPKSEIDSCQTSRLSKHLRLKDKLKLSLNDLKHSYPP